MFDRQSIHIALLLWGCVFCLLAALCMFISRDVDREKKKYMILLQISCAVLLCSDSIAWGFRGSPGVLGKYMVSVSNCIVFVFSDIVLWVYHSYMCCCLFEKNIQEKERSYGVKTVYVICAVAILLVLVSQFTNLYYYIDEQNYYHRNPAYFIAIVLPLLGMAVDLFLLIRYRENISRELFVSMISYIILPVAAAVILLFYYGISLFNLAISVSVILMFVENMIEQSKKAAQQERKLAKQELQLAQQERNFAEQERKLAKTERELTENRIASMMSQIRTHFIFNTLSVISGYCKIDPKKADDALMKFARYLRRNMSYLEKKEMIFFNTEIDQVEDYVDLEQMRFGDMVEFGEELEVTDFRIPPLTVQPLVENAIKHGLTKSGKKGAVCVLTRKEKNAVIVEVTDDGVGFKTEELDKESSIGIRNVRYRLEHMAGATLTIESTPGEGTKATICIPIQQEEEQ